VETVIQGIGQRTGLACVLVTHDAGQAARLDKESCCWKVAESTQWFSRGVLRA